MLPRKKISRRTIWTIFFTISTFDSLCVRVQFMLKLEIFLCAYPRRLIINKNNINWLPFKLFPFPVFHNMLSFASRYYEKQNSYHLVWLFHFNDLKVKTIKMCLATNIWTAYFPKTNIIMLSGIMSFYHAKIVSFAYFDIYSTPF